uniref:Uncharacterized protein n=1 Tax=Lepeophtheirus salmonis TaxID=72036 RepID=A0A0K2TRU7_LEPSM
MIDEVKEWNIAEERFMVSKMDK